MPDAIIQTPPPKGVAVVLPVPADVATALSLDGGVAPGELHVTLAYLPDLARDDAQALAQLRAVVMRWAFDRAPIDATLSGFGRFSLADGDALYVSVDAPKLPASRAELIAALEAAQLSHATTHGFTPHVTLAYLGADAPLPLQRLEARAVAFDRVSLWRGDVHEDVPLTTPSTTPSTTMTTARTTPSDAYGPAVELSVLPSDSEGGPWSTLAYAVELRGYKLKGGGHARITEAHIDEMVANFTRYPKVPLVIEHADTRAEVALAHPDWATPCGHIVALRKGEMTRLVDGAPTRVASLEGRIDASPEVRLAINGDPATGTPATWPFCSITPASGIDEETGADLGTILWSVSLTAHPRLADLPRLAAARSLSPMKNRKPQGARSGAPVQTERTADTAAELGYWYEEISTRGDVLAMLRCVLDLPVAATETETLAALDAAVALSPEAAAKSGVEVGEILEQVREALRLPVIDTTTNAPPDVVVKVREALATLPDATVANSEMSRGVAANHTAPKEGSFMKTFLELAAAMKLSAVATEEAARDAVMNLARDGAAVRSTLSLAGDVALAPRLADLVTASAELPKVREELTRVRTDLDARVAAETKAAAERAETELSRRVDEVVIAKGWTDDVKPALLAFGRTDRTAFDAKYPPPSAAELAQRAQDGARLGRVELNKTPAQVIDNPGAPDLAGDLAKIKDIALEAGEQLTELEAFGIAARMTPEGYARQLGVQTA